jgi:hypothetical protein
MARAPVSTPTHEDGASRPDRLPPRANQRPPVSDAPGLGAHERLPLLELQRSVGNAAVARMVGGIIQRGPGPKAPSHPPPPPTHDPVEAALEGLRPVEHALELSLDLIRAEPLTTEEMYELLLIRRAEPLSLPASQVNEAQARLAEIDKQITAVDQGLKRAAGDLENAQQQRKRVRGSGRDVVRLQIQKVNAQLKALRSQQKNLLAEKVRLTRGRALGTPGLGAAAGTGQITYAVVQVVDANGKRIALEAAETSATEHAEERVVGRLRGMFKPQQLEGAQLIVVVDQHVCEKRCKPALRKFAQDYGVQLVEARYLVRKQLTGPSEATPRTTLRTATKPSSAGVPLTEKTEEIYRRTTPRSTPVKPGTTPDPPAQTPTARRPPTTTVEPPDVPVRGRMRTTLVEAGGNLLVDLVMDLLVAKYQQWRNEVNLRERLAALQPQVNVQKAIALRAFLADPWAGGTAGMYYNVYLRVESTTTTAIGGGHAVVIPGSPYPHLVHVAVSGANLNKLISEEEAVKVPGLREGATGAVIRHSIKQFVVYSQPVQQTTSP